MSTHLSDQELLAYMANNTMFANLNQPLLETLLSVATLKKFESNQIILRQGEKAEFLFMLVVGRAKLTQLTADGTQILIRYIGPGQEGGTTSLLPGTLHPMTVQTMDKGAMLMWPQAVLADFIPNHPQIAINALQLLAQRNSELQRRYQELLTECVAQRLAHALLRLVTQAGHVVAEGVLIDLPLSREDLAQMAGTTLYTVSRTLSFWEQAGLIESGRQRILIKKVEELEALTTNSYNGSI